MLFRFIKWSVLGIVGILFVLLLILATGSRLSLDTDYTHTTDSKALPVFSQATESGLVQIKANGHEFRARIAGFDNRNQKQTVIMLHGFPVTSAMWIDLIDPVVEAGYSVIAFDQRGEY